MKTLLVPCDGSECALRALGHAAGTARDSCVPVELGLLHVLDPISFRAPEAVLSSEGLPRLHPMEAERALRPARAALQEASLTFRESCRIGQTADEIADHVREHGHAGVVMGTRGQGPVASLVPGSVASRVVGLVRVLHPHRFRAKASVLSSDELTRLAPDDFQRAADTARQLLDAEGTPWHLDCRAGDPATEIAAQARESSCDGIIMGTRGLGLMGKLVIGSVASRVVCHVDVPVTLVK